MKTSSRPDYERILVFNGRDCGEQVSRGKTVLRALCEIVLWLFLLYAVFVAWNSAFLVPYPYDLERFGIVIGAAAVALVVSFLVKLAAFDRKTYPKKSFWRSWQFYIWIILITLPVLTAAYGFLTYQLK
jgi:hypothetical protein